MTTGLDFGSTRHTAENAITQSQMVYMLRMDIKTSEEIELGIMCVGVDFQQHNCLPHSNICKCGVVVKRKKLMRDDYQLLSCYECTY